MENEMRCCQHQSLQVLNQGFVGHWCIECGALKLLGDDDWMIPSRPPQEQAFSDCCKADIECTKCGRVLNPKPAPSVEWEKEFDKKVKSCCFDPPLGCEDADYEAIKDFIRQLLRGEKV